MSNSNSARHAQLVWVKSTMRLQGFCVKWQECFGASPRHMQRRPDFAQAFWLAIDAVAEWAAQDAIHGGSQVAVVVDPRCGTYLKAPRFNLAPSNQGVISSNLVGRANLLRYNQPLSANLE